MEITASSFSSAGASPVLVGRVRELGLLRACLAAALAGRGALVLIGGEAGIGKTTLAEAMLAEAQGRGALVAVGRCYDLSETPPYGPWTEALARIPPTADRPGPPDLTGGGAGSQAALFAQVHEYLATLAQRQPFLLLLDDLHWADPASLDLLRVLARDLGTLPLLLLGTYRSDELTRRHPLYALLPLLVREAHASRLDLRPLDNAGLGALIKRYALPPTDEQRLIAYLRERAEGNPFFAGELLRTLEEASTLHHTGDAWALGDLGTVGVPPLLRQVIDARVDRLGATVGELLAAAAIIGQEVPVAVWQAVTETEDAALLVATEHAAAAGLLTETADGAAVRFTHALIREALYAGTLGLHRRALHRRAAEALAAYPAPDPDAVAHHFQRAGDERAAAWLVRAGERAQRSFADASAIARFEEALPLLPATGASLEQFILLRSLASLHRWQREGVAYAREAAAVARAMSDPVGEAEALFRVGMHLMFAEDVAAGLAEQERAAALLAQLPGRDAQRFVSSYHEHVHSARAIPGALAMSLALLGRFADAAAHLDSEDIGVNAAAGGMTSAAMRGHPAEARAVSRRILADLEEQDDRNRGALLCYKLVTVTIPYSADDAAEVRRVAAAATAALLRVGEAAVGFPPHLMTVSALILHGEWDEAWSLLPVVRRRLRSAVLGIANGAFIGELARARGATQLAADLIAELLPHGPETKPGTVPFRVALGFQETAVRLCLDRGDAPGARGWLAAHDHWLDWSGAVLGQAEGCLGWAAYHQASGDLTLAREHAERALAHATEPRQPLALLVAHRLLGELAVQVGDHGEAADHVSEALALADACAAPYERALTLLTLAELREATGERETAETALATARALLEPLGAKPAVACAKMLAARLAAIGLAPKSGAYPAGLTPREVEVLRLVARGLTDAQVAEQLYLSRRTVGQHLRSVYTKLSVDNRAAATRFAVEHHLA